MGMVEKHAIKITRDLKGVLISITGVPTTATAYAHGFDKVPSHVIITHTDYGITGLSGIGTLVREIRSLRNTSSISLASSLSGVGVDILVIP